MLCDRGDVKSAARGHGEHVKKGGSQRRESHTARAAPDTPTQTQADQRQALCTALAPSMRVVVLVWWAWWVGRKGLSVGIPVMPSFEADR